VEGMALAKMASLIFIGLIVPFFLWAPAQYLAAFLPSFWIAKFAKDSNMLLLLPALAVSFAWIGMLGRRFGRKLY